MASQSYIIDQTTERSIDVERFGNSTARQAQAFLPGLLDRIITQLNDTPTDQLFLFAQQVESLVLQGFTDMSDEVKAELAQFAAIESAWAQQLLVEATVLETVRAPTEQILATFTDRPMTFDGQKNAQPKTIDQLFDDLAQGKSSQAAQIFRDGQITGATIDEMTDEISELLGPTSRQHIQTDVLTANKHVSMQARSATYAENDDIIEVEEWISVLDNRTSTTCQSLDGNRWPTGTGVYPPAHRRCRSDRIPVVKEQFRIPVPGGTRASQFGPVNSQLTYSGFLKRRDADYQDEVLGPTKGRLFRAGVTLDKFTTDEGVPLTLDQIRARNPRKWDEVFGSND